MIDHARSGVLSVNRSRRLTAARRRRRTVPTAAPLAWRGVPGSSAVALELELEVLHHRLERVPVPAHDPAHDEEQGCHGGPEEPPTRRGPWVPAVGRRSARVTAGRLTPRSSSAITSWPRSSSTNTSQENAATMSRHAVWIMACRLRASAPGNAARLLVGSITGSQQRTRGGLSSDHQTHARYPAIGTPAVPQAVSERSDRCRNCSSPGPGVPTSRASTSSRGSKRSRWPARLLERRPGGRHAGADRSGRCRCRGPDMSNVPARASRRTLCRTERRSWSSRTWRPLTGRSRADASRRDEVIHEGDRHVGDVDLRHHRVQRPSPGRRCSRIAGDMLAGGSTPSPERSASSSPSSPSSPDRAHAP